MFVQVEYLNRLNTDAYNICIDMSEQNKFKLLKPSDAYMHP